MLPRPPSSTLFPYTTLFRSNPGAALHLAPAAAQLRAAGREEHGGGRAGLPRARLRPAGADPALEPERAAVERALPEERSEEHTSELQSHSDLVCRLLLEKKK